MEWALLFWKKLKVVIKNILFLRIEFCLRGKCKTGIQGFFWKKLFWFSMENLPKGLNLKSHNLSAHDCRRLVSGQFFSVDNLFTFEFFSYFRLSCILEVNPFSLLNLDWFKTFWEKETLLYAVCNFSVRKVLIGHITKYEVSLRNSNVIFVLKRRMPFFFAIQNWILSQVS